MICPVGVGRLGQEPHIAILEIWLEIHPAYLRPMWKLESELSLSLNPSDVSL